MLYMQCECHAIAVLNVTPRVHPVHMMMVALISPTDQLFSHQYIKSHTLFPYHHIFYVAIMLIEIASDTFFCHAGNIWGILGTKFTVENVISGEKW